MTENGRPEKAPAAPDLAVELEECRDRQLRTLADFDNFRRRTGRELAAARTAERDRVVLAWLPVLDHLELALSHASADPGSLLDGVRGVRQLALEALRRCGVVRLDDEHGPFDPNRHEVGAVVDVSATPDPPPAGTVMDVLRAGFAADGRVLRPASVAVSAGPHTGTPQTPQTAQAPRAPQTPWTVGRRPEALRPEAPRPETPRPEGPRSAGPRSAGRPAWTPPGTSP
ncbi:MULTISPECIES: nucleotide exchange factor GrpE [Parafrankia]|nr:MULTISPECIES: nucleotide exchange factor GrpE [Parafrankia]MBE3206186.1 nucleotide exchange factor GrpE [Parafrankia sp. CH37]